MRQQDQLRANAFRVPMVWTIVAFSACLTVAGCQPEGVPARRAVVVPAKTPPTQSSKPLVSTPDAKSSNRPLGLIAGLAELGPYKREKSTAKPLAIPLFLETSADAGVNFIYDNGSRGRRLMVEGTGGGAGWLDYDGDGNWDLYLVQGGDPVSASPAQPSDKLFRHVGVGRFEEVSASAATIDIKFGQGVSIGDFDADGFDDIFVANIGGDTLFHNVGDGTFEDVSASLVGNVADWSTSAAWADIDLDGDLDLYVCRYCKFDPAHPQPCKNARGLPSMCQPKQVPATSDVLFVNQGDGQFLEEAQARGLVGQDSRALGVAVADFNNDGFPDIYVCNDATPNYLFVNDHQGRFRDDAVPLGCSVLLNGHAQGSMGVALGDYDRNGFIDLFISNFEGEGDSLYRNEGAFGFQEVSGIVGLVQPTLQKVGWGTVLADFNQDGHDDLFLANGHIDDGRNIGGDLEQSAQLFSFDGERWIDESDRGGQFFQRKYLGRGVASGDYDDDGDLDLVMVSQNSRAALLRNDSERGHWLRLSFIGQSSNRRGIGTRVTLRSGKKVLVQELAGGTSYCASHQPVLVFGLGDSREPCDLEIRWPRGAVQQIRGVPPDQSLIVRESESQVSAQP